MITHYTDLQLNTVSLQGVKQFYNGLLGIPIVFETETEIRLQVTSFTTLTFTEAGIPILGWPDGREIVEFDTGVNAYFRDGDGHLLEVIAHRYVREDVLPQCGPLKTMYLREVGFPVENVPEFREWWFRKFGMRLEKVYDDFTFAIGGTAHAVIASKRRRWIPIGMYALPPRMTVSFGISGRDALARIRELMDGEIILSAGEDELTITRCDYRIRFVATDFPADIAARLNLPE